MRTNKGLLKSIAPMLFLIIVFQFSGCSLAQKANSESSTPANNAANITSESATPVNKSMNDAEEAFAKQWKSEFEAAADELERKRRLWQESKIINYNFVATKYAGGVTNSWQASPVLIKVREGKNVSTEAAKKGYDYRIDSYADFDTIDKLFEYMRQELGKGKMLEVKYDKKSGCPQRVFLIFAYSSHGSVSIEISKFEAVK